MKQKLLRRKRRCIARIGMGILTVFLCESAPVFAGMDGTAAVYGQKKAGQTADEDTEQPTEQDYEIALPEASVELKTDAGKSALVRWTKVKGAVSYEVQRAAKKNGIYKKLASLGSGRSTYTDKDVTRGNYYYYRVAAVMQDGETRCSNMVTFACPLSQVSGVNLIRYSTSSIKVTWKENKKASFYKVYTSLQLYK